jgi:hypothetical protein
MGILINQGKHVEEQTYSIMEDKNIKARITKLEVNPKREYSIVVTMQIIEGKYTSRSVIDYVDYNPDSKNAWRYRTLRKSAMVPYSKDESERIDIEKLLLNKIVTIDVAPRTYEYQGETKTVQNVSYKEPKTQPIVEQELKPEDFMEKTKQPLATEKKPIVDDEAWPF